MISDTASYPGAIPGRQRKPTTQPSFPDAALKTPQPSAAGVSAATPATGMAHPNSVLSAPRTPAQSQNYAINANNARAAGDNALAAPLPTAGATGAGTASITLDDGRTITRTYSGGRYHEIITHPGMIPGQAIESDHAAFPGYTQPQVDRIASDRQNFAQKQHNRADQLTDASVYPGYSADRRHDDVARSVAMDQAKANTAKTNAEASATTVNAASGVNQTGSLRQQVKDLQTQLQQRDTELQKYTTAAAKPGPASRPAAAKAPSFTSKDVLDLAKELAFDDEHASKSLGDRMKAARKLLSEETSPVEAAIEAQGQGESPASAATTAHNSYKEGDVLSHDDGRTIVLKNGQWVPLEQPQTPGTRQLAGGATTRAAVQ